MGNLTLGRISFTPAAVVARVPASQESASFSDDALAQTEATWGDDNGNRNNASLFLIVPGSQYTHDLILKYNTYTIALQECSPDIPTAEGKMEEQDRK